MVRVSGEWGGGLGVAHVGQATHLSVFPRGRRGDGNGIVRIDQNDFFRANVRRNEFDYVIICELDYPQLAAKVPISLFFYSRAVYINDAIIS